MAGTLLDEAGRPARRALPGVAARTSGGPPDTNAGSDGQGPQTAVVGADPRQTLGPAPVQGPQSGPQGGKKWVDGGVGGHDVLSEFHAVFSENMRDLGTPSYGAGLFAAILDQFPGRAEVCVVR